MTKTLHGCTYFLDKDQEFMGHTKKVKVKVFIERNTPIQEFYKFHNKNSTKEYVKIQSVATKSR